MAGERGSVRLDRVMHDRVVRNIVKYFGWAKEKSIDISRESPGLYAHPHYAQSDLLSCFTLFPTRRLRSL